MRKLYESWKPQIEAYFKANNLNYEKVKKCGKCMGKVDGQISLVLQKIGNPAANGLLDETPAPVVLIAVEENGELIFEKTEITDEYFKMEK